MQGADRDAAFDTLTVSIGAAIAAERTLDGICDWVEVEEPRPVDLPVEGAASLKAAVITVVLHYSTVDTFARSLWLCVLVIGPGFEFPLDLGTAFDAQALIEELAGHPRT